MSHTLQRAAMMALAVSLAVGLGGCATGGPADPIETPLVAPATPVLTPEDMGVEAWPTENEVVWDVPDMALGSWTQEQVDDVGGVLVDWLKGTYLNEDMWRAADVSAAIDIASASLPEGVGANYAEWERGTEDLRGALVGFVLDDGVEVLDGSRITLGWKFEEVPSEDGTPMLAGNLSARILFNVSDNGARPEWMLAYRDLYFAAQNPEDPASGWYNYNRKGRVSFIDGCAYIETEKFSPSVYPSVQDTDPTETPERVASFKDYLHRITSFAPTEYVGYQQIQDATESFEAVESDATCKLE